jgi:hypothetical protein
MQTNLIQTSEEALRKPSRTEKINTPAELIIVLHQQYPKDDKLTACTRFVQTVLDQGLFHQELAEAFHSLNYNRLTQKPKPRAKLDAEALAYRTKVKANMMRIMKTITLNTMIAGKKLRDWRGTELAAMCSGLAPLGNHCGRKKIGSVFTSETLKAFSFE